MAPRCLGCHLIKREERGEQIHVEPHYRRCLARVQSVRSLWLLSGIICQMGGGWGIEEVKDVIKDTSRGSSRTFEGNWRHVTHALWPKKRGLSHLGWRLFEMSLQFLSNLFPIGSRENFTWV